MKYFKYLFCFLVVIGIIGRGLLGGDKELLFQSYVYHFDFENGAVGSWSSYPPAQDTGYDPTISVSKIGSNSTKALVREISPHYEITYKFGMREKVDLFVDRESELKFQYYVKNYRNIEGLVIKFAFENGKSYRLELSAKKFSWEKVRILFKDVTGDKSLGRLKALAFMVVCPQADPESILKFAIDDVKISGYRKKGFKLRRPDTYWVDEFHTNIALRHYDEGDPISIEGKFPLPIKEAMVTVSRKFRKKETCQLRMAKSGKTHNVVINSSQLGSGIWQAEIEGICDSGTLNTSLVFLVKKKNAPRQHPWLLISQNEKAMRLKEIRQGYLKNVWVKLQDTAKNIRNQYNIDDFDYNLNAYDEMYWLPTYGGYAQTIKNLTNIARLNGLVYYLSGDKQAGDSAKKTLLKMASWPTYVHPHVLNQGQFTYWPVGLALINLALGFDTVYDHLSPEEREKIAEALYHKGVTEVFKEYVRDNRVSSNTSNWISHVTGGGILSALAISREYADNELEPFLTGMILKLGEFIGSTFDCKGSYGEGYGYHNFTMQTLIEIMVSLKRHFGIQFPEKIFSSYLYLLYQINPETLTVYDFGDTTNHLRGMSNFSYLLNLRKSPHLKWLYDLSPGYHDTDLLFYKEGIKAQGPSDLPLIQHFPDVGTVIFRSGFNSDDFMFVFRSGPFYNHQHFDQGSFFLSDKAEDLITEPGKTDYYEDPWYQKLFIQPGAHNCILVDETVECQRAGDLLKDVEAWSDYAHITDFIKFDKGAFASSNLAPIYKGKFQTLTRNILYLKPRTIILIDRGEGAADAERMNLRFHPPLKKDVHVEGKVARIQRPKASLYIKTISPKHYQTDLLKRPLTLAEFQKEDPVTMEERGFLQLTSDLHPQGTAFINVMSTDKSIISGLDEKHMDSSIRFTVDNALYYLNTKNQLYDIGQVQTDALVFRSLKNGFIAFRTTQLLMDEKKIVQSSDPVSLIVNKGERILIKFSASKETELAFFVKKQPQKITIGKKEFPYWTYKDQTVFLDLPKGGGTLRFTF